MPEQVLFILLKIIEELIPEKLVMKKYDKKSKKHEEFVEKKLK